MDNIPTTLGNIWSNQREQTEQQHGNTLPAWSISDSANSGFSRNHSGWDLPSTSTPLALRTVDRLSSARSERIKQCVAQIESAFPLQKEFDTEEARMIEENRGCFYPEYFMKGGKFRPIT